MPIKIVTGRNAKTKNLYLRGTHLGVRVDQSCKTAKRPVARRLRDELETAIERGEYPPRAEAKADREQPTFLSAANAYMAAGKRRRHLKRLILHFGEKPLSEFSQAVIDEAAAELLPGCTPGARNAAVYTPASAVLHHTLGPRLPFDLKRPKGAKGRRRTDSLTPQDAFGIIEAAEGFDIEFATLLLCLLYVGPRIGAGLDMQREDVRADELAAWMRHQKGQPSADVRLREDVRDRLVAHLESHERRRVFRFHYGGHLKYQLVRAKLTYLGIPHPRRRPIGWREPQHRLKWVTFHSFRHTWATWMRRYGKATVDDLVDSKNWSDRRSAAIYIHAVAEGVWDRVDLLPSMGKTRGKAS